MSLKSYTLLATLLFLSIVANAQTQTIKELSLDTIQVSSPRKLQVYKNYKHYRKTDWVFNKNIGLNTQRFDSLAFMSKMPQLSPKGIVVYNIIMSLHPFTDSLLRLQLLLVKITGKDTSIAKFPIPAGRIKNNKWNYILALTMIHGQQVPKYILASSLPHMSPTASSLIKSIISIVTRQTFYYTGQVGII